MVKPLLLEFRPAVEKPLDEGLKFVLFRLNEGDKMLGFDYGFANFSNGEFETIGGSDAPLCTVVKWCTLPSPKLLL